MPIYLGKEIYKAFQIASRSCRVGELASSTPCPPLSQNKTSFQTTHYLLILMFYLTLLRSDYSTSEPLFYSLIGRPVYLLCWPYPLIARPDQYTTCALQDRDILLISLRSPVLEAIGIIKIALRIHL
jgi:hypothetical protein